MAIVFARTGLVRLTSELFGSALENWQIGLFSTDVTPSDENTISDYLAAEANFSGYVRKTLTRTLTGSTWGTPTITTASGSPAWTSKSVARSQYGAAPQTWTNNGGSPATVYGYFVVGSSSGVLIYSDRFAQPWSGTTLDTITFSPFFEFAGG